MLLVLNPDATSDQIDDLIAHLEWLGLPVSAHTGGEAIHLHLEEGSRGLMTADQLRRLPLVREVRSFTKPYRLAGKELDPSPITVEVGGVVIGGGDPVIIAGPCSVESEEQIYESALLMAHLGADMLRGGAYKPRTSPYTFQGLGKEGLRYLKAAAQAAGLPTVSEVMEIGALDLIVDYVDVIQVGARNMQNTPLLKALGTTDKPVLLKRGFSATYEELLLAAEYIMSRGNDRVILCERGIRTFEPYTRNTLDLAAVPALKELGRLPVIVDPSHACGKASLVPPMAKAAIAAGADGVMLEVHPHPEAALTDRPQALSPETFAALMPALRLTPTLH
ncbi:MAG: 3-deoxy-7-phosphoheptulonate synthase [Parachlamydiales bacterium]